MLEEIKARCYITTAIYDKEIESLINSCIIDCINTGIKEELFEVSNEKYNDLVLNCVTAYVKAHRGNDRTDTDKYLQMYLSMRDKMSLIKDYRGAVNNE